MALKETINSRIKFVLFGFIINNRGEEMKLYCIKQHDITDCGAACLAIGCTQMII